jgi:hypothetical protein
MKFNHNGHVFEFDDVKIDAILNRSKDKHRIICFLRIYHWRYGQRLYTRVREVPLVEPNVDEMPVFVPWCFLNTIDSIKLHTEKPSVAVLEFMLRNAHFGHIVWGTGTYFEVPDNKDCDERGSPPRHPVKKRIRSKRKFKGKNMLYKPNESHRPAVNCTAEPG